MLYCRKCFKFPQENLIFRTHSLSDLYQTFFIVSVNIERALTTRILVGSTKPRFGICRLLTRVRYVGRYAIFWQRNSPAGPRDRRAVGTKRCPSQTRNTSKLTHNKRQTMPYSHWPTSNTVCFVCFLLSVKLQCRIEQCAQEKLESQLRCFGKFICTLLERLMNLICIWIFENEINEWK